MKSFIYATCLLSTVCDVYATETTSSLTIGKQPYNLYKLDPTNNERNDANITIRGTNIPVDYIKYHTGFKQGKKTGFKDLFLIDKNTTNNNAVLRHFYCPGKNTYLIEDENFTSLNTNNLSIIMYDPVKYNDNFTFSNINFSGTDSVTLTITDKNVSGVDDAQKTLKITFSLGNYADVPSLPPAPAVTPVTPGYLNPQITCNIAQSYIDASVDLSASLKGMGGITTKNGLTNLDPQSYIIFGNNGLGYSRTSAKTNTQNVPTFCPTLQDFSVITTDCIEELAHNCMPVILTTDGQGATFPGAKDNTSSPSYINTNDNTTDFYVANNSNPTDISSSQTFLSKTYATFPFPGAWNGLNYDGYNVPLPGFSPVTVPNTANTLLSGYQGSTLPIQVSALNKYYIYTLAGGTNYTNNAEISFDFCLASDSLMTKVTKWGRLDVTLS